MQVQFAPVPHRKPANFQVLAAKSSPSIPDGKIWEVSFSEMPDFAGAPEGIRTPDPQIRSLVLYPAELPALGMSDTS
jgi:hypothetical protein